MIISRMHIITNLSNNPEFINSLPDNPADLAVETARAISQLEQLEESFIAVF